MRQLAPKFWNWTSKIVPDLWLLDLFCPIKKISTLHPPFFNGYQKSHELQYVKVEFSNIFINP